MKSRHRLKHSERSQSAAREIRRVAFGAAAFAIGAVITLLWPVIYPHRPERVVTIYWTHGCDCADQWIASLKAARYDVHDFEQDNLNSRRRQLRVPHILHGCHLASYLGYFIEGHVPPEALERLARERPAADGLAYIRLTKGGPEKLYLIFSANTADWIVW